MGASLITLVVGKLGVDGNLSEHYSKPSVKMVGMPLSISVFIYYSTASSLLGHVPNVVVYTASD